MNTRARDMEIMAAGSGVILLSYKQSSIVAAKKAV